MKKKLLFALLPVLVGIGAIYRYVSAGPEPSVSLYWYEAVDPTIAPGVCAPQWQLLIRTDTPAIYAHTGTSCTAWLKIGTAGGGTVTSVSCGTGLACSPGNPITTAGTASLSINGGATQTCSGGNAVTSMTAAGIQTCSPFVPAASVSGTTNDIAKFTSNSAVGNSALTDDGTTFAVGANKLTVTEASGNTAVAGTLTADSGNRVFDVAGTGLASSTNTVSLLINGGATQTCAANNAVTALSGLGITTCTAFTPSGS